MDQAAPWGTPAMSADTRQLLREAIERRGITWDAVTTRVHLDNAGMEFRDAEWLVKSLRDDKSAPMVVAAAIISLLSDAP